MCSSIAIANDLHTTLDRCLEQFGLHLTGDDELGWGYAFGLVPPGGHPNSPTDGHPKLPHLS